MAFRTVCFFYGKDLSYSSQILGSTPSLLHERHGALAPPPFRFDAFFEPPFPDVLRGFEGGPVYFIGVRSARFRFPPPRVDQHPVPRVNRRAAVFAKEKGQSGP